MKPVDTSALETALEQKKPTKKMSLVRQLMPKINLASSRGLSKKEIWESLNDAGLEMSYKMFVTYLSRIESPSKVAQSMQDTSDAIRTKLDQESYSTHEALDQARQHTAQTDYSKLMRNRPTRIKK